MIIVYTLALLIPPFVLPGVVIGLFDIPKTVLLLIGTAGLVWLNTDKLKDLPKPVLLLIVFNLTSLLYTLNPYYTKVAVVLNISCLLIYYFTSLEITRERAKNLAIIVTMSGLIVSIISWCQYFGYYPFMPWFSEGDMIFGTIGNSNYLGAYLIFPLFTVLGLIFTLRGKWRYVFIGALIVIAGAFLIARARAAFMGIAISLPIFFFLIKFNAKKFILVVLFLIFLLLNLINLKPDILNSTTLKYRLSGYFPPAVEIWTQSPLFGTGLRSYRNQVYEAQARLQERGGEFFNGPSEFKPRRVHNDYLETLVDGGIIGFLLCFVFLCSICRKVYRYLKKDRDLLVIAYGCAIISILINALLFFPFRVNATLFMTCLFLGVLEGLCKES